MEAELKGGSDNSLANGSSNSAKRGRGRPKGSVKKVVVSVTEVPHNARAPKRIDFFCPETVLKTKVKKRGRPKKVRVLGRPRKIPLTPEEEAERILRLSRQKKRKLSKPLGRPGIHPLVGNPAQKKGRGRPRKYEALSRASPLKSTAPGTPQKRGRPQGLNLGSPVGSSPAKSPIGGTGRRRGRPPGSGRKITATPASNGSPRKRGRPPGSGNKLKITTPVAGGTPGKRGRPPGSGLKIKLAARVSDGVPRKRGRPPGSGNKLKITKQDINSTPQKRGRPSVSGNATTPSSSNAVSTPSGQTRKRGRPSKTGLAQASLESNAEEEDAEVNDASTPKRPRSAFTSSEGEEAETVVQSEDPNASENEVVMIVGDSELKDQVEEVQEVLLTGSESNSKKSARGAGKTPKKK
ncbi:chromosomal protein D1 [Astyanax mexicanus]|uniref:chromosomal protein D1 n=1 Tax=Astyanax mexicanus TaxID=7994 RepID=UPI000BBDD85D|nr:chromosomal protein D1 [Astyanax mexicanus]